MTDFNQPIISIIIPSYNYGHTLERAILSVYTQMDVNCEIIVVNDGSTDNTSSILEVLEKSMTSVYVFTKENGGSASARNFGIKQSKGSYYIFLDADDTLYEDAIVSIRHHLKTHQNAKFIIGGYYTISAKGEKKRRLPKKLPHTQEERLKAYLINKTISLSNGACVMHQSIFENNTYPEHFKCSEDLPVFAHALVNFECSVINKPIANIYKHTDSLRHHLSYATDVGLQLVDEVFSTKHIPLEFQHLKQAFLLQRLLSLSKISYENDDGLQCIQYFTKAMKLNWKVLLKWSYSKKFIKSLIHKIILNQKNIKQL